MTEAPRPRRLVLMAIDGDDDAAIVRRTHESFTAIPGVRCLSAVAPSSCVSGEPSPYTHVSLFEFADAEARRAYTHHPAHRGAHDLVRAHLAAVLVLDLG